MADSSSASSTPGLLARLRDGLSILDFALALVAVLVVSALAIPSFFAQPRVTLDHAALLLAHDLRYAQNEAALCAQTTEVHFAPDGDGYAVRYRNGQAVANPVGGADLVRQYSFDAVFRGVSVEPESGIESVSFDRSGFALDEASFVLRYGDETRRLVLERGSGLMRIEGLKREWRDDGL